MLLCAVNYSPVTQHGCPINVSPSGYKDVVRDVGVGVDGWTGGDQLRDSQCLVKQHVITVPANVPEKGRMQCVAAYFRDDIPPGG